MRGVRSELGVGVERGFVLFGMMNLRNSEMESSLLPGGLSCKEPLY